MITNRTRMMRGLEKESWAAGWVAGHNDAVRAVTQDALLLQADHLASRRAAWYQGREAGHQAGRQEVLEELGSYVSELLGRCDEIGRVGRNEARKTAVQWRDERLAEMDQAAQVMNQRLGKHPKWRYRGGAVDWETGLPVGSECARLRSRKAAA